MNNFLTAGMQNVGATISVRTRPSSESSAIKQAPVLPPRDTKNVSQMARMMAASRVDARIHSMSPERLAALRASDWHLTSLAQAIMDEVGL